jgi:hypothetical protein
VIIKVRSTPYSVPYQRTDHRITGILILWILSRYGIGTELGSFIEQDGSADTIEI